MDTDIDRSQPWQVQRAERLSRGVGRGGPFVRRQVLIFAGGLGALVLLTLAAFVVSLVS